MARQPDIQYIQYNYGNTARKLELKPQAQKKKYQLPEQQNRRRTQELVWSPLPLCSVAVSLVMCIAMVLGILQIGSLNAYNERMADRIEKLTEERAALQAAYENAYEPEAVIRRAGQMGLVDASQVAHISMTMPRIPVQEEPDFGSRLTAIWNELFAKAK